MDKQRYQITKRSTLISGTCNIFLALTKLLFGYIGHSQALVADGIHSFSDLLTDGLVLIAAKSGSRQADKNHPYGHGRIETASTIVVAMILISVGIALGWEAVDHTIHQRHMQAPSLVVLVVAALAIVVNQWIYRYLLAVSRQIRSALVKSNAIHHKTDVYVSAIVLLSVLASMLGFKWVDSIGAFIIATMIIYMGGEIIFKALRELVDTAVDDKKLESIKTIIQSTPGVESLHQIRSRTIAGDIFIDVHVIVSSRLSVSEGHQIGEQVERHLLQQFDDVTDVVVHIDPENDEIQPNCSNLPHRDKLIQEIKQVLQTTSLQGIVIEYQLHYLSGKIEIDYFIPLTLITDKKMTKKQIQDEISKVTQAINCVKTSRVYFK